MGWHIPYASSYPYTSRQRILPVALRAPLKTYGIRAQQQSKSRAKAEQKQSKSNRNNLAHVSNTLHGTRSHKLGYTTRAVESRVFRKERLLGVYLK